MPPPPHNFRVQKSPCQIGLNYYKYVNIYCETTLTYPSSYQQTQMNYFPFYLKHVMLESNDADKARKDCLTANDEQAPEQIGKSLF